MGIAGKSAAQKKSSTETSRKPSKKHVSRKQSKRKQSQDQSDAVQQQKGYRDRAAERREALTTDKPKGEVGLLGAGDSAAQLDLDAGISTGIDFGLVEQTRMRLAKGDTERSAQTAKESEQTGTRATAVKLQSAAQPEARGQLAASLLSALLEGNSAAATGGITVSQFLRTTEEQGRHGGKCSLALAPEDTEALAAAWPLALQAPVDDEGLAAAFAAERLHAYRMELEGHGGQAGGAAVRPSSLSSLPVQGAGGGGDAASAQLQVSPWGADQARAALARALEPDRVHRRQASTGPPARLQFLPWRTALSFPLWAPARAGNAADRAAASAKKRVRAAGGTKADALAASAAAAALCALPRVTRRAAEDCSPAEGAISCPCPGDMLQALREVCEAAEGGEVGLRRLRRRRRKARERERERGEAAERVGSGVVMEGEGRAMQDTEGSRNSRSARFADAGDGNSPSHAGPSQGRAGQSTGRPAPRGILRNKGERTPVGPGGVSKGLSLSLDPGAGVAAVGARGGGAEVEEEDEEEDIFADAGEYDSAAVLQEAAQAQGSASVPQVGSRTGGSSSSSGGSGAGGGGGDGAGGAPIQASTGSAGRRRGWAVGPEGGLEAQLDLIDERSLAKHEAGQGAEGVAFGLQGAGSGTVDGDLGAAEEDEGVGYGGAYDSDDDGKAGEGAGSGDGEGGAEGAGRAREEAREARRQDRLLDREVDKVEAIMKRKRDGGEGEAGALPTAPGAKRARLR